MESMPMHKIKVIISGGGTGGHIFPAIAIADALKRAHPSMEILFVGALGKMEMEKVPAAGYKIIGIPVRGLQRRMSVKNLWLPFRLFASILKARKIIKYFKPDVVVGVGGYASGPVLLVASMNRIPTLIQEQNSYAGITNRLLAKRASKIAVAYHGMDKFFPSGKIILSGNPVRKDIVDLEGKRSAAAAFFDLDLSKKTVLVIGGSLGALSINESTVRFLPTMTSSSIQLIWQCGNNYFPKAEKLTHEQGGGLIRVYPFITRMDLAYAMADVVVSRAGAIAISELCVAAKPAILIPSPNVAEDHQTHNAMALVSKNAAILIKDDEATLKLGDTVKNMLSSPTLCKELSDNISALAFERAAETIANEILMLASKEKRQ